MATLFIASSEDKRKAESIAQAIEDGKLPKPTALHGMANICAKCDKLTLLARFYIPLVGWSCQECFDDWRGTPVYCSTRADDVHRGRVHVIPQCVIDAEAKQNAPQKPQDARSAKSGENGDNWVAERVAQIKRQRGPESVASEVRWHAATWAAMAKRNAALGVQAA